MSSRTGITLALALLAAAAGPAAAADWAAVVAASDRRDDSQIIDFLKDADLQTSVEICQAIGSRRDPYAADILSWLLDRFSHSGEYKTELLLRIAMSSLFDESRGDAELKARLSANASVLDDMVRNIDRFQDPQLQGTLVGLLPRIESAWRLRALMEVGSEIVDGLRRTEGFLSAPETALALDYLAVTLDIGTPDFLDQCVSISELSRDKPLVQRAREVWKALAGRAR